MKRSANRKPGFPFLLLVVCSIGQLTMARAQESYSYKPDAWQGAQPVRTETQFNGYTNFWHDDYKTSYRYGNLYKISMPDAASTLAQAKIDVADDMGLPGLLLQEGFIAGLLSASYTVLNHPAPDEIARAAAAGNVLITADPASESGKRIAPGILDVRTAGDAMKSHQYQSPGFQKTYAYWLDKSGHKVFVLLSSDSASLQKVLTLLDAARATLDRYDLRKGWFGTETLLKSVTCMQGHPLDVIGRGMNEGNSWFVFSGYMEFLAKEELRDWTAKVGLPVVTDVGFAPIFGCADYDGLQVQDMQTKQAWIDFAHKKKGYSFRPPYDPDPDYDAHAYDGYLLGEGNKEQADNDDIPFVTTTGGMPDGLLNSMILFTPKDQPFTRERLWEAIMQRKAVAVLDQGKMMGPAAFRQVLDLLLLDRVFLENYYGDRVDLNATVNGYTLEVTVRNMLNQPLQGNLGLRLPPGLRPAAPRDSALVLAPGESKEIRIALLPSAESMNTTNPIAVYAEWDGHRKGTVTLLDLPPAISVHRLLYGLAPKVSYPVTIHNFTTNASFPVKVEVLRKDKPAESVYTSTRQCTAATGQHQDLLFDLKTPPGDYLVKVSALGVSYTSQLGVRKPEGKCFAYALDLNSDGIKEYRMENDSVEVTLLATGARIIDYTVKSRKDDIFFKLWPGKASDDKRAFRKRGYYPFGGFEDFLGQGSMEENKIYDAQLIQKEGEYVQVKMTADYFGNRLEKTFTLFGNSPLLEIRWALTFINPEAKVIGPQPILELGKEHGPEDVFIIPDKEGLQEMRMRPEMYFGHLFHLKEGWNAGYDTKEDISFVGAYPADQPLFLHVWMNHPRNTEAHYYYSEFQPWTPIFQKSTMYFSYYIWGAGGSWQESLKALRSRNLITENK